MKRLVIFGVSNMLSDIFDCALALGYTDLLVVPNTEEALRARTRPFRERIDDLPANVRSRVVAFDEYSPSSGDDHFLGTTAAERYLLVRDLRERFGIRLAVLAHPAAYVSPLAKLAEGVFVGAGSVIAPAAVLHECTFVNRAASIGHDTVIGPYARVQPGAHLGGHVRIGAFVTVGIGAAVFEETIVGDGALIAGGSVVKRDIEQGRLAAGDPAVAKKALDHGLPSWQALEPYLSSPAAARR